ncbi:3-beta hydroxysteroid dehydrogenase/isomerase family protein [Leptolyngbya boryana NIES-2135]|jgi:dihydroflavonol-4-reductase|uniref:3-beta hydroxysteroid dehydrogenase/isomerase family protein n=1 Tax=Leptolyngbya boryana NIES-2135 TaxID=1973484 RepID=A0A1Z4JC86_LEPBY|nr:MULTISPECIES: NAD-dependent epimerase/dehydratase family protein [Leptolyngbya]BAY54320.1 3-beta hydroxysteroid dehydrogenase/isomerase family protein [Leptolyngbya boryana NIES-2135]MBD2370813.1 NAD-dependent epimerase/dehydratase family protein [Leptolyngbya sp. FACHB-161]MBD2377189.1 NAD-dependent epimerase/dehydratase family protein [Leptolyngbya sp. FACHB-238]MBD2401601.1 NAD-dependent epimerase/dehydratase family protein [Leptolyngbya sp. FACHB-239]MBD2408154.1 NAD-dependent epimerase
MRALVTGANGFTGSHLVKLLLARGDSVTGLVRKSSNVSRLADCDVKFVYGDITDRAALTEAMTGVDVVFHTAAYVELGIVNAVEMERVNVEGTRAVLEVAKAVNVPKMIYCSTIGIFGDTQGNVINETFQRTQAEFSSAYDRTKYQAQQLVDQAVKDGLWVASVMPSGIFGKDDPHFLPVLSAFQKGRLKVWAGGSRVTGIVHVDDLAEAMILAVDRGKSGEYYIISAGDLTTQEMFEIFSQETGIPAPREAPKALVRIVASILDPIGRLSGWQPPIDNERVHYLYDRCVRVDATKARQELGWNPRSPEVTLKSLMKG